MDRWRYDDPTGGGDDIVLLMPKWTTPPGVLSILDINNDRHEFTLAGPDDDEEDEG